MHSYWLDTSTPSGDYGSTPIPKEVDVAVVGGGFTGLSTAYHAAKAGKSVALLEANTVNWGASGRNGGMATTGLAIGFRSAMKRYGEQRAIGYFREYNKAIDLIERLVEDNDLDVDYERSGKMTLAWKASHFEGMQRTAEDLKRLVGQPVELVDRAQDLLHVAPAFLELAGDAFCRLGDVAYERAGRGEEELRRLRSLAEQKGVHLVWSNVHVHLAQEVPDKGEGLLRVLAEQGFSGDQVLTIGDAPNDAGLFVADRFGVTVGTADVTAHASDFRALPDYVSTARESEGFLDMLRRVKRILRQKSV